MKSLNLALAAALSAVAFGAHAATIETDYPVVQPASALSAQAEEQAAQTAIVRADPATAPEPVLIQSNYAGPEMNAVYAPTSTRTRAEVSAEAEILVPRSPGLNA